MKKRLTTLSLILCCGLAFAQPKANSKVADDLLIKKLTAKLNLELVLDELTPKEQKNQKLVKKMLAEYRGGYDDGNVTYAPDNKFKLIVIEGVLGANAVPIYASYLDIGGKLSRDTSNLYLTVKNIYKLSANCYLVMHGGMGGAGTWKYDHLLATLLTIENGSIVYPKTNYGRSSLASSTGTIQVSQRQLNFPELELENAEEMLKLDYDTRNRSLSYSYLQRDEDTGTSYHYKGIFKYLNNTFVFQNETKTIVK